MRRFNNFETIFYPLTINYLDAGNVGGPADYAKAITDFYVKAAKVGAPGGGIPFGMPPAVPAPANGPGATYPMTYLPIGNYTGRQRKMERVLKTYFEIKDSLILDSSIKSIVKDITSTIKRSIVLQQQIKDAFKQVSELKKQLEELPEMLIVIAELIHEVILKEGEKIDQIVSGIDFNRLQINGSFFKEKFQKEIQLIETIKNFKGGSTKISDYLVFADALNVIEQRISSLPDTQDGTEEQDLKKYINKIIKNSLKSIVNWSSVFSDPVGAIDFVRSVAREDEKFKPALAILYKFKSLQRILKPKLAKLKIKLKTQITILEEKIKTRIQEKKEKLKALIKKRKEKAISPNAKTSFFVRAAKFIKTFKKETLATIKRIKKIITEITAIISKVDSIIKNSIAIQEDVKKFINEGAQKYIDEAILYFTSGQFMSDSSRYTNKAIDTAFNSQGRSTMDKLAAENKATTNQINDLNTKISDIDTRIDAKNKEFKDALDVGNFDATGNINREIGLLNALKVSYLEQQVALQEKLDTGEKYVGTTSSLNNLNADIAGMLNMVGIKIPMISDLIKEKLEGKIPSTQVLIEFLENKSDDGIKFVSRVISVLNDIVDVEIRVTRLIKEQIEETNANRKAREEEKLIKLLQFVPGADGADELPPEPTINNDLPIDPYSGKPIILKTPGIEDLPQNQAFAYVQKPKTPKPPTPTITKMTDVFGREVDNTYDGLTIFYYSDGTVKRGLIKDLPPPPQVVEEEEDNATPLAILTAPSEQVILERPVAGPQKPEPTTLESILIFSTEIQKKLKNLKKKMRAYIEKQEDKIEEKLAKLKDGIRRKALNLVPISSDKKAGKTKAEIILLRKQKIEDTKLKIQKAIRYVKLITTKIIPGAVQLIKNLIQNKDYRYTSNQSSINKLIDGLFGIKIERAAKNAKNQLAIQRDEIKKEIQDYLLGAELLYDFAMKVKEDISQEAFMKVFMHRMEMILTRGSGNHNLKGYEDFYNKIQAFKDLTGGKATIMDYIKFFEDKDAFRVLETGYIKTMMGEMERAFFQKTLTYIENVTKNTLVQKVFPEEKWGLARGSELLLTKLISMLRDIINRINAWLNKMFIKYLKPITDWVKEKLDKEKKDLEEWIQKHIVNRMKNLDLKLSRAAYNLATKVFWTGFRWKSPDNIEYLCRSIGTLPSNMFDNITTDDGPALIYNRLATHLGKQLTQMQGIVFPPPNTGGAPIPFTGYYS